MRTTPCSRPDRGSGCPGGPERSWSIASRVVTVDGQALGVSGPHPHPVAGEVQEGLLHDVCGGRRWTTAAAAVLVPLCRWRSGSIRTCIFSHSDTAAFPFVTAIGDQAPYRWEGAQRHPCCTYRRSLYAR